MTYIRDLVRHQQHGLDVLREAFGTGSDSRGAWRNLVLELAIQFIPYFEDPATPKGRRRFWNPATKAYLLDSLSLTRQKTASPNAAIIRLKALLGGDICIASLNVRVSQAKKDPELIELVVSMNRFPLQFKSVKAERQWRRLSDRGRQLWLQRNSLEVDE